MPKVKIYVPQVSTEGQPPFPGDFLCTGSEWYLMLLLTLSTLRTASVIDVILSQMRTAGVERLSNLLSVTQLVYDSAKYQTEDSSYKACRPSITHPPVSPIPKNDLANPPTARGFYYSHFQDQEMEIVFTSPWLQSV